MEIEFTICSQKGFVALSKKIFNYFPNDIQFYQENRNEGDYF